MKVLVTGSAGHLGEALVRTLQNTSHEIVSLDITPSPFTSNIGSVADRSCVRQCMRGVDAVLHAATLHKPHVVTHSRQDFVDTNITGTLNLLEEAASAGVVSFVFSTRSQRPDAGHGRGRTLSLETVEYCFTDSSLLRCGPAGSPRRLP